MTDDSMNLTISSIVAVLTRKRGTPTAKTHERSERNNPKPKRAIQDETTYTTTTGWRRVAHVTLVQHQHCRVCNATISAIAGEFTEFVNARMRSTIRTHRLHELCHGSTSIAPLPVRVDEAHVDIAECAACISLSRHVDDLLAALNVCDTPTTQQELFQ